MLFVAFIKIYMYIDNHKCCTNFLPYCLAQIDVNFNSFAIQDHMLMPHLIPYLRKVHLPYNALQFCIPNGWIHVLLSWDWYCKSAILYVLWNIQFHIDAHFFLQEIVYRKLSTRVWEGLRKHQFWLKKIKKLLILLGLRLFNLSCENVWAMFFCFFKAFVGRLSSSIFFFTLFTTEVSESIF